MRPREKTREPPLEQVTPEQLQTISPKETPPFRRLIPPDESEDQQLTTAHNKEGKDSDANNKQQTTHGTIERAVFALNGF